MREKLRMWLAPAVTTLLILQSLMPGVWADNEAMVAYHDAVSAASMNTSDQLESEEIGNGEGIEPEAGSDEGTEPEAGSDEGTEPDAGDGEGVDPDAGSDEGTEPEAGSDEGTEPEAGSDEGTEPDAGSDEGTEPEAGSDEGTEPDAGSDEGTEPEAGSDEGTEPDAAESIDSDAGTTVDSEDAVVADDDAVAPATSPDADVSTNDAGRISPMALDAEAGVTDMWITPETLVNVCDPIRIDGTWAVNDEAQGGDQFTFTFDDRLQVSPGIRNVQDSNGNVVAYMTVQPGGNVATFVLSDAVNDLDNVNGTFFLESSNCLFDVVEGYSTILNFSASNGNSWSHQVNFPLPGPNTVIDKTGVLSGETITWTVTLPAGPSDGVTLNDPALAGWTFDVNSFNANNVAGSDLQMTGDADSIQVTSAGYGEGTPSFTIEATLDADWADQGLPVDDDGGTIFNNTISGTNKGLNGETESVGPEMATVTKPLPPGPNTVIDKTGVLSGETITWTVTLPAGPSNGVTLNDEALAGWTFDYESFSANNVAGSDLQVSGDANGITVTSAGYGEGTPSFTIDATLDADWADQGLPTDNDGGTIFYNEVEGSNTGLNGETEELGPEEAQVTKPLPPGPGTEISKSGEFTADETITWTIFFPAGPSAGATINDLNDLEASGWEFDTDSFNPNNVGGSNLQMTVVSDGITVTSGDYDSGVPSFTIEANLVDGWEELDLDVNDDGETVFKNTIAGTNTGINGDEVDLGPIEIETGKPLPPGPNTVIDKTGVLSGETITWTVTLPAGPSNGVTLNDPALAGWTFDYETFNANNVAGSDLQVSGDANGITVTSAGYGEGTPSFTIDATLDADWADQGLPTDNDGGTIFNNEVEGSNIGLNGETEELGPEEAQVTKPLPPGPGTEISKSGEFTGDETITWTVTLPAGPSNGVTLNDPALAGWTFDVNSFNANNVAGSDLQMTGDANSITVTSEGYGEGTPSFTIDATLADGWEDLGLPTDNSGGTIFTNEISGTNTGLNGETEALGPETGEATKPGPPETGTNPTKKGNWVNEYDQGLLNPTGAIQWTIMAPHGPASEIVITDTAGGASGNWEFVCDEGNPANSITLINAWTIQNGSVDVQCSPEELVVTFTNVAGDEWNPVGFVVDATITTPFADGQGFNNEVISVTNNINGTISTEGEVTSEWLVQDSDFGGTGDGSRFVIPMAPTVEGAVCENGVDPDPQIVLPNEVPGLSYQIVEDIDLSTGDYVVKATKDADRTWGSPLTGWVEGENENEMIFNGNVDIVPCEEPIVPVAPSVTGAVCEEGVSPDPQIVVATSPEGVEYAVVAEIDPETGDYIVSATITGENLVWGDLTGTGWVPGETENEAIYNGNVDIVPCEVVELVLPTADAAVCEGGVDPDPTQSTVVTGEDTDLVSYEVTSPINEEGVYIVTATKHADAQWPADLGEWVPVDGNSNQVTYTGQVEIVPCEVVELVLPTADAAVCEGGVDPDPTQSTVVTGEDTDLVSYEVTSPINEEGVYVVTATKDANAQWPSDLGEWVPVDGNSNQVTYTGQVEIVPCEVVELVLPTADAAVCEGGVDPDPTQSTVVTGEDTDLVSYEVTSPINEEGVYVVTATKDANAQWPSDLGEWEAVEGDPNQVTYTGQVEIVECEVVDPIIPEIVGNVCEGGEYTPPTVVFGDPNEDIEYSNGVAQGGQITAEAMLTSEGTKWGDLTGTGWTVDPADPTRATFLGEYTEAPCAPVVPSMPVVEEAVCTGGVLIDPVVTITDTDRITYTTEGEVVSGGTVIVTATLTNGFEWDTEMPEGWTVNPENPAQATFVVELEDVECTPVVPEAPEVTPAVCGDGMVTTPTVEVPTTPGITYTKEGEEVPGGTVTVIAAVEPGYEFGALPEGWTQDPNDPSRATYTVELEDVECTPVVPEAPEVTPALCEDGEVVDPTVTTPTTPGVTYTKSGEEVPGGTVVITATIEDGYEWGEMPEGWMVTSSTTATYEVTLGDYPCEPVSPEIPTVTPAVCEDGEIVNPNVTTPTTPGVTYTKSGEEVPGGTVIITATIEDGYEWGEMPEGWTLVDASTATFEVTLAAAPDCEPEKKPDDPITTLPSTGSGSEGMGLGLMLAAIAGMMLAAVGLRLNASRRS